MNDKIDLIASLARPTSVAMNAPRPGTAATLQELLTLFASAIMLCLIIALITLAIVQMLRPLVRGLVQYLMLMRWHRNARRGYWFAETDQWRFIPRWLHRAIPPDEGMHRFAGRDLEEGDAREFPRPEPAMLVRSLPDGLLMKQLQDAATLILARPSLHMSEYFAITSAASREDRDTILYLDFVSRTYPERLAELARPVKGKETGYAEAITAAQQAVSAATERHLDALQLQLEGGLAARSRALAIVVGIAVAMGGASVLDRPQYLVPIVIGALGGLLSSLFYEAALGFIARRR